MDYKSKLDLKETQIAIKFVKDTFQKELAKRLNLLRVSAPLFVYKDTGLNDNLSGVEQPVNFEFEGKTVEIVQSLAKWKRMALSKYNFEKESGLYTDMNAIRKDEIPDFIHSMYVDQWDYEKVIDKSNRTLSYLKKTVRNIYKAIYKLNVEVSKKYPELKKELPKDIYFISSSKLLEMYPNMTSKERENEITRTYKAVFIYQIGGKLKNGMPHDSRAADYDDWKLNGDILLYYPLYDMALELSSMGIRVDENSLVEQLKAKNETYKMDNPYCQDIINCRLPYTLGGGIGQSRLCMYFLEKAHIGEVQSSLWPESEIIKCKKNNISLL